MYRLQMDASYNRSMVEKEILGSRTKLAACGIPEADIVGFRQPFLKSNPTVRQVRTGRHQGSSAGKQWAWRSE